MSTIDWRTVICRKFSARPLLLLWCVAAIALPEPAAAVDDSLLWLPRNYYRHKRHLYHAAEVAEQTEQCRYVIAGTINQDRSTQEHPVFKITCRDADRQTFAFLVDGLSYDILNRPPPPDPEEIAKRELQQRLEKKWMVCFDQLEQRTDALQGLTWSTQDMPEATMNGDDDITFEVDFNAASEAGNVLHYRAQCHFQGDDKKIDIYSRLEVPVFVAVEAATDDQKNKY